MRKLNDFLYLTINFAGFLHRKLKWMFDWMQCNLFFFCYNFVTDMAEAVSPCFCDGYSFVWVVYLCHTCGVWLPFRKVLWVNSCVIIASLEVQLREYNFSTIARYFFKQEKVYCFSKYFINNAKTKIMFIYGKQIYGWPKYFYIQKNCIMIKILFLTFVFFQ